MVTCSESTCQKVKSRMKFTAKCRLQTNGKKVNWKQLIYVIENEGINWNNSQQVSMRTVELIKWSTGQAAVKLGTSQGHVGLIIDIIDLWLPDLWLPLYWLYCLHTAYWWQTSAEIYQHFFVILQEIQTQTQALVCKLRVLKTTVSLLCNSKKKKLKPHLNQFWKHKKDIAMLGLTPHELPKRQWHSWISPSYPICHSAQIRCHGTSTFSQVWRILL